VIDELLNLKSPPTALVLGNNQVTIATIRALKKRNISIPSDIAIAVFDDFPWADLFHPRLTAVSQPLDELGKRAVELIMRRIREPEVESTYIRLEPEINFRESCGCTS
jgi:LacI family transcriptional regulator